MTRKKLMFFLFVLGPILLVACWTPSVPAPDPTYLGGPDSPAQRDLGVASVIALFAFVLIIIGFRYLSIRDRKTRLVSVISVLVLVASLIGATIFAIASN